MKNFVNVDTRFQKSINLTLDTGDMALVNRYIPTRSSVSILKQYLTNIVRGQGEHATILIGPYGKGKSHLLLVLLALLCKSKDETAEIQKKIIEADNSTKLLFMELAEVGRPFLPVIVSSFQGDLNESFIFALQEALKKTGIRDLPLPSEYSEAVRTMESWKESYPDTYQRFEKMLEERGCTASLFKERLKKQKEAALLEFKEFYPVLTSGSVFNPMVQKEALRVYEEVNRVLCAKYGYAGIYIIFDEFSKYIEGHEAKNFAKDMKILQDMCELADSRKEEQMYLTFVAHKSIHEYVKSIDSEMIQAFRGVEGRLKEIRFVVSSQNNYELIEHALHACEPGSSGAVILEDVVKEIGAEYEKSIRSWLQAEEYPIEEKEQYLEKFGLEDVQREAVLEEIKTGTLFLPKEEREDNFSDRLKERKMQWGMHLCEYLRKCIEDIRLYEIAISVNDKKRAIDIYENLNLGGKSLSVFDLILAKASRHTQEKGNLFTQIVDDIERDHREEYTSFVEKCSTGQKNSYKNHIADSDKPYSAVGRIGCWDKSQKELSATYIKALMNLLGIIDYFSEGDPGFSLRDAEKIQNLNVKVTKREYLLQIPSEKIYGYVEVACQGLDRAALFLQMRCGIRKLGEIHYNLMWVILGTVFLDEAWFEDSEVLDYMEVWYWSAILSGEFKIEQNRAFIRNLQNVLSEIQNIKESDKKFTKALCNNVLTDKKFADRDIVLMKNPSVYPEEVIGNTICQFYLSETYSDILKPLPEKNDYQPQTLSALNNSVKLQKHHIMPIGSLSVKYKDANKTTESRRKDNSSPYNSPLNFLLISEKANGLIQNSTLKEYFEFCDQTALNNVDIKDHTFTDMSKQEIGYRIGDEALQIFLEKRYDDFKSRITSKCRNLLNCPDICCGEGGN